MTDHMQYLMHEYTLLYQAAAWFLTALGIWKILEKCHQKGFWGLIPGFRYDKLAQVAGRESEGVMALVFEIPMYFMMAVSLFMPADDPRQRFISLAVIACGLIMIIYKIRVTAGLARTFGATVLWSILWAAIPYFPALLWGYSKHYQPVNLGKVVENDLLAGTAPAVLPAALDHNASDDGLVIHIRQRTAWDFIRRRYLLKDINLTIPNGSLVLLLGGSGSGKTTLVNAINGYEKADAKILLNGVNVYENYEQMKYRIGYVPQQDLLRQNDTVNSTLQDAARLRMPAGTSNSEMRERVQEVMDSLGMTSGRSGLVAKKSGGQKKRISIGMELISDPELFILDEPDSGLDGVIARELFEKLKDIAESGKIVITITHIPDRVADLFDYVIVLARDSGRVGRLAFFGTPDEAREFFGQPTMERIVMCVNRKDEGGEGRADEFIAKYARMTMEREAGND